jgi:uncharacterized protein (DUF1697 family)
LLRLRRFDRGALSQIEAVEGGRWWFGAMTVHVALLRAVNVGGRSLAMADLKAMLEALGLGQARTLLQSGNVVLDVAARSGDALESFLEAETQKRLRLKADYLVRTAEEWRTIIADNPFRRQAKDDPARLLLILLKTAPTETRLSALKAAIKGRETVRPNGRELYVVYPDGIGRSKLTIALIERKLATRCTARNWNTVLKLQALAETFAAPP